MLTPLVAQTADAVSVTSGIVANGGQLSEGTDYSIRGTVGEAVVGVGSGSDLKLSSGLWAALALVTAAKDVVAGRPSELHLGLAYPNPSHGPVTLDLALPSATTVDIGVFDVAGRQIRTLATGRLEAGMHRVQWDGLNSKGYREEPGMYFLRLLVKGRPAVCRRVVLVLFGG